MTSRGHGTGPFEAVEPLEGGSQNILLILRRDGCDYVLRRPPLNKRHNSDGTMLREARVLAALRSTDVPHPRMIDVCEDVDVIGSAFFLMELVQGFGFADAVEHHAGAFRNAARCIALSLVDGASALGRVDPAAVGLENLGNADGWLERQVPRWRRQLNSYAAMNGYSGPADLGAVDLVGDWLDAHCPRKFTPGIIHGDFHVGNVLISEQRPELAAIVDWELATIGDPLLDLAHLLATWPDRTTGQSSEPRPDNLPARDEMLERYATQSSRDVSAFAWYRVLACYRMGIILEGTKVRADAGLAPRQTGDRLHAVAASLFRQARRLIAEEA